MNVSYKTCLNSVSPVVCSHAQEPVHFNLIDDRESKETSYERTSIGLLGSWSMDIHAYSSHTFIHKEVQVHIV